MTKEMITEMKRTRLEKILARPGRKSNGVVKKLQRQLRNLEK